MKNLAALLLCVATLACAPSQQAPRDPCAGKTCNTGETCDPADGQCKCGGTLCASGESCHGPSQRCLQNRCTAGSSWTDGTEAFVEATDETGLSTIGVEGVRISLTDIDGDGWADISSRRGGLGADDFNAARVTWLLRNRGDGTFEDVTQQSGLVQTRYGTDPDLGRPADVVIWADVDNDGDLDAFTAINAPMLSGFPDESAELMLNDGTGHFTFGPAANEVRREADTAPRLGAAFVDVNRDGNIDLWVGNSTPQGRTPMDDELHLGEGDGNFYDATADLTLTSSPWLDNTALNEGRATANAWSALACDLTGDGNPELLVSSYGRAPNHLFVAQRDGAGTVSYRNASVESGYAFDHRTDWSDNESARCWCKLHPTDEDCAGVPPPAYIVCNVDDDAFRWNHATDRQPYRLGGNSGTTVCADVDNDGDLDLLTTEIKHWDVGSSSDPSELLLNDGTAHFTRPGNEATGLMRTHASNIYDDGDITAAIFDFDNDMRPDIYIGSTDYPGTRGWLWHQLPDGTFETVSKEDGIDHKSSHGIGVADFDHDGDLDVVVGHSRNRCQGGDHCYPTAQMRLFRNTMGQAGNWVQLHLVGAPGTNRAAIGARVSVTAGGVTQTQEVGGGHGHVGMQHDLVLHFGLGSNCVASVTVRWPDANLATQSFDVPAGYRWRVTQGSEPVVVQD
ncbi:MAG: CRTAC1 family protein [Myxococcota bacterium]